MFSSCGIFVPLLLLLCNAPTLGVIHGAVSVVGQSAMQDWANEFKSEVSVAASSVESPSTIGFDFITTVRPPAVPSLVLPLFLVPVALVAAEKHNVSWPSFKLAVLSGQVELVYVNTDVVVTALNNSGLLASSLLNPVPDLADLLLYLSLNSVSFGLVPYPIPGGLHVVDIVDSSSTLIAPSLTTTPSVSASLQFQFPSPYPFWAVVSVAIVANVADCQQMSQLRSLIGDLYNTDFQSTLLVSGIVPLPSDHTGSLAAHLETNLVCSNQTVGGTVLRAGGASFPALAWQGLAQLFHAANPMELLVYSPLNSVEGFNRLQSGQLQIAGSDVPVNPMNGRFTSIPFVGGGIAVIYNIPSVASNTPLYLSRAALVGIFNGTIANWSHPVVQKSNPLVILPNEPIIVLTRSDSSATTANFKQALAAFQPLWAQVYNVSSAAGQWPPGISSRMHSFPSESLIPAVAGTLYSIAYVSSAVARENAMPMAAIENHQGVFVQPLDAGIAEALVEAEPGPDLVTSLVDQAGDTVYPISVVSYCAIPTDFADCEAAHSAVRFLNWSLWSPDAAAALTQLHFAPLTNAVRLAAQAAIQRIRCAGRPLTGWTASGRVPDFFVGFASEVTGSHTAGFDFSPSASASVDFEVVTTPPSATGVVSVPLALYPLVLLVAAASPLKTISLDEVGRLLNGTAIAPGHATGIVVPADGFLLTELVAQLRALGVWVAAGAPGATRASVLRAALAAAPTAVGLGVAADTRNSSLRLLPLLDIAGGLWLTPSGGEVELVVTGPAVEFALPPQHGAYPLWRTLYAALPATWAEADAPRAAAVLDWVAALVACPPSAFASRGYLPLPAGLAAERFHALTDAVVLRSSRKPVAAATLVRGAGTPLAAAVLDALSVQYRRAAAMDLTGTGARTYVAYAGHGADDAVAALRQGVVDFAVLDGPQQLPAGVAATALLATALAVAFNLPGVSPDPPLMLTRAAVVGIFNGSVTTWRHPLLTACNPLVRLPDAPLVLVVPRQWTGATGVLRTALCSFGPAACPHAAAGDPAWRWLPAARLVVVDVAELAATLADTPNAISYIGLSDCRAHGLRMASLEAIHGGYVDPSFWSVTPAVANATAAALGHQSFVDLYIHLSYPIVMVLQLLVRTPPSDCANPPRAATDFLAWALNDDVAARATRANDFVQLSAAAVAAALEVVEAAAVCPPSPLPPPPRTSTVPYIAGFSGSLAVVVAALAGLWFARRARRLKRERARLALAPRAGACALCFTDVQRSTELWEEAPDVMKQAIDVHHSIMREHLEKCLGYEVKTGGDSFFVAFREPANAIAFAMHVQEMLLQADWPFDLTEMYECRPEWDLARNLIYKGLRVRIGLHYGTPEWQVDGTTNRVDYYGPCVNMAARTESAALGGQVLVTREFLQHIEADMVPLREFRPPSAGRASSVATSSSPPISTRSSVFRRRTVRPRNSRMPSQGPYLYQSIGVVPLKGLGDIELFEVISSRLLGRVRQRSEQSAALHLSVVPQLTEPEDNHVMALHQSPKERPSMARSRSTGGTFKYRQDSEVFDDECSV